jgi:hypothetical protein
MISHSDAPIIGDYVGIRPNGRTVSISYQTAGCWHRVSVRLPIARALLDELAIAVARAEATPLDPAEVLREVLGG